MTGKILILAKSDDPEIRILFDALKKQTHFIARVIASADLKAKALMDFKPDLVFLDASADTESVFKELERLKKDEVTSDLPVIVAGEEEWFAAQADRLSSGIADIAVKPFRIREVLFRLTLAFRKTQKISDANLIRSEDLEIDVARYEVRIDGDKVDLTFTEYELLKFFASHPGQVFNRDVLLNKVWGYDYFGGARTVDVHVRRLRAKIETGSRRYIETVRNIGYRFTASDSD